MTNSEANRLLGKVDESQDAGEQMLEPFIVGETVKIIDGAFSEFVGDVQEVNEEKKKLKVMKYLVKTKKMKIMENLLKLQQTNKKIVKNLAKSQYRRVKMVYFLTKLKQKQVKMEDYLMKLKHKKGKIMKNLVINAVIVFVFPNMMEITELFNSSVILHCEHKVRQSQTHHSFENLMVWTILSTAPLRLPLQRN